MPGRGVGRQSRKDEYSHQRGSGLSASNVGRPKALDFSRLKEDAYGYYNICFQKPEGDFHLQEIKTNFEDFGRVAEVHCATKTVFVRFCERDAAQAAVLALLDSNDFTGVSIPACKTRSTSREKGLYTGYMYHQQKEPNTEKEARMKEERDVSLKTLPDNITEQEVLDMVKPFDAVRLNLQYKADKTVAVVKFPNEAKATEFIISIKGKATNAQLLSGTKSHRRSKSQSRSNDHGMPSLLSAYDYGGRDLQMLSQSNAADDYMQIVQLWVGNYPKDTTQAELEKLFRKFGGAAYITMKTKKDKEWGYAFVGLKNANQANRAIAELNHMKIGKHNIGVRLSHTEYPASESGASTNSGLYGYEGYEGSAAGYGLQNDGYDPYSAGYNLAGYDMGYGSGYAGQNDMKALMNSGMDIRIHRASHLARRIDFMTAGVLDDCLHCDDIRSMVTELRSVLDSIESGDSAVAKTYTSKRPQMNYGGGQARGHRFNNHKQMYQH